MAAFILMAAHLIASPVTSVCLEPEVVPESGEFSVLAIPTLILLIGRFVI